MGTLIVYDTNTGTILRNVSCPDNMESLQANAGEEIVSGSHFDPSLYYVVDGVVSDRPLADTVACSHQTIQANGVDEVVISGIPNPSRVTILDVNGEGGNFEVVDGQIEASFDTVGVYTITVIPPFPSQIVVFSLEAV